MTYNKNTWNPYNSSMTYDQNKTNGGVVDSVKLNNMETGISNAFDKTSDSVGGRNLVKDSEQEISGKAYGFYEYSLASLIQLTPGKTYTISCSAKVDDKAVNCKQFLFVDVYDPLWHWSIGIHAIVPISTDYQRGAYTFTIPEGQTGVTNISAYLMHPTINGKFDASADKSAVAGTGYIKELKLEQGSIATDWTPAPEDKVNVSDMRKPAGDVAGIEEVNAKQDKIGYTPADDSKVVHHTIPKSVRDMNDEISDGLFYDTSLETLHSPFSSSSFYYQVFAGASGNIRQVAYANLDAFNPATRSSSNNGSTWTNWNFETIVDDDGLMTYGSSNWQIKVTNDSKVAHLSGKNNFDTVPTVNNNPLLLASSLPSDLARTGSNQEFTGKNTFDTAPIDKTTGHPYITKDGVPAIPSTLADTTKDANFTGKLQKSGIDVATKTDVSSAVNTATSNFSKHIEASKNNEDSAISDSTKGNSNDVYYWTEG